MIKRSIILILILILPSSLLIKILRRVFQFDVADGARIGFSIVLVDRIVLGCGARIGHLNVIKGLSLLDLADGSIIGNINWISAFPSAGRGFFESSSDRRPALILERQAALTTRHFVDCTDTVRIGEFSTIAGMNTQILTHSIDIYEGVQKARPVTVGKYSFVGTRSVVLAGSSLPSYSVLGAGSVLNKRLDGEYCLYAGTPARPIRILDRNSKYFCRIDGVVR